MDDEKTKKTIKAIRKLLEKKIPDIDKRELYKRLQDLKQYKLNI